MQASYDLTPLIPLLLLGGVLALATLAWVWRRQRQATPAQRLHRLTLVTLFLTFDLVLFGAFTRLSDSGLGCPDWPGCYGYASPVGAAAAIGAAQDSMPTGPVTHRKAWIEMVHRYLATTVGALIVALAGLSWLHRQRLTVSFAWPLITLAWVCLQGAFGALTVTMKLFPAIVTLHLLGGLVLLALLRVQILGPARMASADAHDPLRLSTHTHLALVLVFAMLWLQIALGAWVSTNYAVLACSEFPTCQGSWWPPMDLGAGFTLWRDLGLSANGQPIPFAALTAIHYMHRLMAYGVFLALCWLIARLWKLPAMRSTARWLLALAVWQLLTGLGNVMLDWPLLAALGHTAGAAGLVIVMTGAIVRDRRHAANPVNAPRSPISPLSE